MLALVAEIVRRTAVPVIAAGGIAGPEGVAAVRAVGAVGAMVGTAFLRCPEAGTSAPYRAALAAAAGDPAATTTVTRAFSGRRARGLVNRFLLEHVDAPRAYPEINNATRPLRAAAAAAGDDSVLSLWAGQGFRATTDRPAAEVVDRLAGG